MKHPNPLKPSPNDLHPALQKQSRHPCGTTVTCQTTTTWMHGTGSTTMCLWPDQNGWVFASGRSQWRVTRVSSIVVQPSKLISVPVFFCSRQMLLLERTYLKYTEAKFQKPKCFCSADSHIDAPFCYRSHSKWPRSLGKNGWLFWGYMI